MPASDDLTLRIRSRGGRAAARDVDETRKSVDRFGRSSRQSAKHAGILGKSTGLLFKPFHHLREEAFGLAKGVAAAGLAFGSVEGIKRSIETTDELVKTTVRLHQQFGLTEQSASGLAGVLQARDLQPQALQMGLTTLSKQLIAAEHGSKRAQGAFRLFGIDARGVHNAIGSRDGLAQTFETITDRMTAMHGGARKAALGQQLLGRASRGLAPLMQEGALGLKQQLKWAREFGVTLDNKTVGSVEDMAAAQTEAQYAMLGLQIQLGRFAAPAVAKANIALADIVRSFREGHAVGGQFSRTVFRLGEDLKPVGHDLEVVGGFLADHPKLLEASLVGFTTYKLGLIKLFAPEAFAGLGAPIGIAIAAGITSQLPNIETMIADKLFGKNNAFSQEAAARGFKDLLGPFSPESTTTGKGDVIPRHDRRRGRDNVDQAVAYFRKHPRELTPTIVDAMSQGQRNALGVHTAPNAAGGEVVVHNTVNLDGKQIAESVHRQAIRRKANG